MFTVAWLFIDWLFRGGGMVQKKKKIEYRWFRLQCEVTLEQQLRRNFVRLIFLLLHPGSMITRFKAIQAFTIMQQEGRL